VLEETVLLTESFESTNSRCPVVYHELTSGADEFNLVNDADGSFTVTINERFNSIVGLYSYSVQVTAEGGAQLTANGEFEV
jgi:hypothetical protein